jgi:hypothetical protein
LTRRHLFTLAAIPLLILSAGCSDRNPTDLPVARANIDPMVFDEKYDPINVLYGEDAYFQPFSGTDPYSLKVDSLYASNGKLSIKISVPPDGSALGAYAGGVLTAVASRDFADFNALTFKARTESITGITLDMVGFGNDNTGTSLYEAGRSGESTSPIVLGPDWTFVIVPIPAPSKVISERGLLTFAEGWEDPHSLGYDIWFDEIKFAQLDNITEKIPRLPPGVKHVFVGSTAVMSGTQTFFVVDGAFIQVDHSSHYFDYKSEDPSVARVVESEIQVVGEGTTTIRAFLEGIESNTSVELHGYFPPTVAATPPTVPADNVISMFSDVYTNVPVDTWRTDWSPAQVQDHVVAGDNTKMYTGLPFVGIEFLNPPIDATGMTHIHLDVYAPTGSEFRVKLVSFPSDPDIELVQTFELILNPNSVPPFDAGAWAPLDIPLADFQIDPGDSGYTWDDWDWANVGQMVLSTAPSHSTISAQLVLVDNVYWHK